MRGSSCARAGNVLLNACIAFVCRGQARRLWRVQAASRPAADAAAVYLTRPGAGEKNGGLLAAA